MVIQAKDNGGLDKGSGDQKSRQIPGILKS